MIKFMLIGLIVILAGFAIYVSSQPDDFYFERSATIQAPPEVIYPYLSDFKRGSEWSPYEKMDPQMKKEISDPSSGEGATMRFEGQAEVGSGKLTILKSLPNKSVEIELQMTKPFESTNLIEYRLEPTAEGTRFTWAMSGKANFIAKLMGVVMDCESMMADQFQQGFQNIKQLVEKK